MICPYNAEKHESRLAEKLGEWLHDQGEISECSIVEILSVEAMDSDWDVKFGIEDPTRESRRFWEGRCDIHAHFCESGAIEDFDVTGY